MLSVNEALSYKQDAIGIGRKGTIDKPYILKAPFWTVDTLFYAFPKGKNELNFLNCIFQNIDWKKKDESTGVPSLSKTTINDVDIYVPEEEEQKAIGEYFLNIDNLITLHQRNSADFVSRFFSDFTNTWEQRKLGEYVSIISGEAPSKFEEGTELYVKVDDLNYNDKYVVDTQNKVAEHSTVKRVTKGSVVFPKRGAAIMTNKVRIMGIDGYMDTNMMALTSEKLDSEFLYNIISKEGLYKIADTSTIPQINNKHIEPYEVTIPSLDEQRRIGAYFRNLDNLITLHQCEYIFKKYKKRCDCTSTTQLILLNHQGDRSNDLFHRRFFSVRGYLFPK